MSRALLIAHTRPRSSTDEADFNTWYAETHIPQVIETIPGIVGCTRFHLAQSQLVDQSDLPSHNYVAFYDVESDALSDVVDAFAAALTNGTIELHESVDVSAFAPQLLFYSPIS